MKDYLIKGFVTILGLALLAYVGRLYTQGATLVADEQMNLVAIILVAILGLYMAGLGLIGRIVPTGRFALALLGLIIILISEQYFIDAADVFIYMGDILKLVGVFLIVAGLSKLLVTESIQKAQEEMDIEVIEV